MEDLSGKWTINARHVRTGAMGACTVGPGQKVGLKAERFAGGVEETCRSLGRGKASQPKQMVRETACLSKRLSAERLSFVNHGSGLSQCPRPSKKAIGLCRKLTRIEWH
jgi:hypothetical protein